MLMTHLTDLTMLAAGAIQAQERIQSTGKELQVLAAPSDRPRLPGQVLGALSAMCLDAAGSDLRCSVVCAKLALDAVQEGAHGAHKAR